jgi:UDP-N-acetyl-D-mannosaminuronate dehydrogenase
MLGLSYKRDLKVHTLSPALRIIEGLRVLGIDVRAFDPYYTDLETYQIAGVKSFSYPEGLSQFAGIIIVPPHRMFGQTPKDVLFKHVRKGQVILDNEGIWEKWRNDFVSSGVDYHRVGDKGWCL